MQKKIIILITHFQNKINNEKMPVFKIDIDSYMLTMYYTIVQECVCMKMYMQHAINHERFRNTDVNSVSILSYRKGYYN